MLKVINDHNIAQDGVDPGMDVIHDLKVALEKQRILDEERKAQLLKELAETGWKPERREKNKRNYGIPYLEKTLKERKEAAGKRAKLLNELEELGWVPRDGVKPGNNKFLQNLLKVLNELKELGWVPQAGVNYEIPFLKKTLKEMKKEAEAKEMAKVLNELEELGWVPQAGVYYPINTLQNLLETMKEERNQLLNELKKLGIKLVEGVIYTNEEIEHDVEEMKAANRR